MTREEYNKVISMNATIWEYGAYGKTWYAFVFPDTRTVWRNDDEAIDLIDDIGYIDNMEPMQKSIIIGKKYARQLTEDECYLL